jgi:hypothetical protein
MSNYLTPRESAALDRYLTASEDTFHTRGLDRLLNDIAKADEADDSGRWNSQVGVNDLNAER